MEFFGNSVRVQRRRVLAQLVGVISGVGLTSCGGGEAMPEKTTLVGTWAAPVSDLKEDVAFLGIMPPVNTVFQNMTIRQLAHIALGGDQVRIRFSNVYGAAAVVLLRVRVARSQGGSAIELSSDTRVTFQGSESVSIPPGTEVWSDRVAIRIPDGGDLAISVYVQNAADCTTAQRYANEVNFMAQGDFSSQPSLPVVAENQTTQSYWMNAIDVYRSAPAKVMVVFGDSLSNGDGSTLGANRRYLNQLFTRIRGAAIGSVSVVNAGLSGNRWLHNRFGLRGVERLRRDALGITGVTHAIVQMGINDIGFQLAWTPDETATSAQLISCLSSAVEEAKAAGVQICLATLSPFKGHAYYSEPGEAIRQEVNAWIRNHASAKVADFDVVVRDPADPSRLLAAYRDPDQLHLNDAGHARLAEAVPLDWLG